MALLREKVSGNGLSTRHTRHTTDELVICLRAEKKASYWEFERL
jgi:hypothetical protein